MQRRVYTTRLRPEYREQYLEAHRNMASALLERYALAGMRSCGVYLLHDLLVLIVEAENLDVAQRLLAGDALDRDWQRYVAPMKADGGYQEMKEIFRCDW